jgi:hypothetical protein
MGNPYLLGTVTHCRVKVFGLENDYHLRHEKIDLPGIYRVDVLGRAGQRRNTRIRRHY